MTNLKRNSRSSCYQYNPWKLTFKKKKESPSNCRFSRAKISKNLSQTKSVGGYSRKRVRSKKRKKHRGDSFGRAAILLIYVSSGKRWFHGLLTRFFNVRLNRFNQGEDQPVKRKKTKTKKEKKKKKKVNLLKVYGESTWSLFGFNAQ